MTSPAQTQVVAAVVTCRGRYLVGRRAPHKQHGGLWEFPGGKVRLHETLQEALDRELREELGVRASKLGATLYVDHDPSGLLAIHFIAAELSGRPFPMEHTALAWLDQADLVELELAPADTRFLCAMKVLPDPSPGTITPPE